MEVNKFDRRLELIERGRDKAKELKDKFDRITKITTNTSTALDTDFKLHTDIQRGIAECNTINFSVKFFATGEDEFQLRVNTQRKAEGFDEVEDKVEEVINKLEEEWGGD